MSKDQNKNNGSNPLLDIILGFIGTIGRLIFDIIYLTIKKIIEFIFK